MVRNESEQTTRGRRERERQRQRVRQNSEIKYVEEQHLMHNFPFNEADI